MTAIREGELAFLFPGDWKASKYDGWAFYRNQLGKRLQGTKGADIVAVEPGGSAWLIEVKDYRRGCGAKASELPDEIALKARDTLAGLAAAQVNATDEDEKAIARAALRRSRLRVVLHLEQPTQSSKLFPRPFDLANVTQKMRQLLKPIDPYPCVVDTQRMSGLAWRVTADERREAAP